MKALLKIFVLKEGEHFSQPADCPRVANLLATALAAQNQRTEASIGFESAANFETADFVLYPNLLDSIYDAFGILGVYRFLRTIRNFTRFARKTIFFFGNDAPIEFGVPSIFVRQSVDTNVHGTNTIAFPYVRDDLGGDRHFDWDRFKFETSFVGFIGSYPVRFTALESFFIKKHNLRFFIKVRDRFYGHTSAEREKQKEEFLSGLRDAVTVLCPRGTATNSFRFFEALCMGRIPVLLSDNCGLPFESEIPYNDLIISIPEAKAAGSSQILEEWIGRRTREEILERGRRCRALWESYFSKDVAIDRLLAELARYQEKLPALSDASTEWFHALGRDDQLFRSLQAQCDDCLKKGDDVNAVNILVNIKGVLAAQKQGSEAIDKSIADLRSIMVKKIRLYVRHLDKLSRSGVS